MKTLTSAYKSIQANIDILANHLIVIMAFFLPISNTAVRSGIFTLVLLFIFVPNHLERLKKAVTNPVVIGFALLWLLYKLSPLYSVYPDISWRYSKEFTFLLYPMIMILFLEYKYTFRIFSSFILGVLISEILSYGYFFELLTSPIPYGGFLAVNAQNPSPFTYHVPYGYILALASSFILYNFIKNDHINRTLKFVFFLFFITITLNLFVNSARTGYILYLVSNSIVLLLIYKKNIYKIGFYLIPAVLLMLILVTTVSDNLGREFKQTIGAIEKLKNNDYKSSLGVRAKEYVYAVEVFKEKMLIGYGGGTHTKLVALHAEEKHNDAHLARYLKAPQHYSGYMTNIDGYYAELIVQFGILGLFVLMNLFYQIFIFKQTSTYLNTIKTTLVLTSILYAIAAPLTTGLIFPALFVCLISFTLVNENKHYVPLPKITLRNISIYLVSGIFLFVISKFT